MALRCHLARRGTASGNLTAYARDTIMPDQCQFMGLAALAGIALACQPGGPNLPHVTLGPDAAELRAAFNADTGTVRVVMLVAPT
jgi:hypothetical protein